MPSPFALWLDSACSGFDYTILGAVHRLQQTGADAVLGPLARLFSLLGRGGIALILLGLFLLAFRRTRRYGAAVLLSLAIGALLTNVLFKPLVARPRPYAGTASVLYRWWREAGASFERDLSFPSGHTTAAMAAMSALFFLDAHAKRTRWLYLLPAFLMGFSRLYLVVHYPTDVLAGLLTGLLSGALAAAVCREKKA